MPENKKYNKQANEAVNKASEKFLALGLARDVSAFEQDPRKYMELSYKYHKLWLNFCYQNSNRLAGLSRQIYLSGASSIRAAQEAQDQLKKEFEQQLSSQLKEHSLDELWLEEQTKHGQNNKYLRPIYNHHALIARSLEEMKPHKKRKERKAEFKQKTFTFIRVKLFFRNLKKKLFALCDVSEKEKKETIGRIVANVYQYQQEQLKKKAEQLNELKKRTIVRNEKTFKCALIALPIAGLSYSGFQLAANTKDMVKMPKPTTKTLVLPQEKPESPDDKKTAVLTPKKQAPRPKKRQLNVRPKEATTKSENPVLAKIDSITAFKQKIKFSLPELSFDDIVPREAVQPDTVVADFSAYEKSVLSQKDKDMAEFCNLYRQCAHDNYIKLECGDKKKAFREANVALQHYGFSKLSQGLHCSGMSMASLCEAADIFIKKHPQSSVSLAIKDILKNCNNVHSCLALKNDLASQTGAVKFSNNIEADIKRYMQDKTNAIVFVWTKRSKKNFHHQTFFSAPLGSNQAYVYCAYNNQHWGGEQTFSRYMRSRRRYGNGAYFTDIGESINLRALHYVNKEIARHKENVSSHHDNLWASTNSFSQTAEFIKQSIFTR